MVNDMPTPIFSAEELAEMEEECARPGKFEGEGVDTVYFHGRTMDGDAECLYSDESGESVDIVPTDDDERAYFAESGTWFVVRTCSQGFVTGEWIDDAAAGTLRSECEEARGPAKEDYVISDDRGRYSVGVVGGRHVATCRTQGEAELAIVAHVGSEWRPNVWNMSDHGNALLVRDFQWERPTWIAEELSADESGERALVSCRLSDAGKAEREATHVQSLGASHVERDGELVYCIVGADRLDEVAGELLEAGRKMERKDGL